MIHITNYRSDRFEPEVCEFVCRNVNITETVVSNSFIVQFIQVIHNFTADRFVYNINMNVSRVRAPNTHLYAPFN